MKRKNKGIELSALKGKMRENKVTYRELAEDIDMSVSALNSKLNGFTPFNLDEAAKVINRLEISPNEIMRYFFPAMLRNASKAG